MTDDTRKTLIGNRLSGLLGGGDAPKKTPERSSGRRDLFDDPPHRARRPDDDLTDIPEFLRRDGGGGRSRFVGPMHDDVSDLGREPPRNPYGWERGARTPVATTFMFESAMKRVPVSVIGDERMVSDNDFLMLVEAVWGVLLDALSEQRITMPEKNLLKSRPLFAALIRQMVDGGWHEQAHRMRLKLNLPARQWKVALKKLIELEPGDGEPAVEEQALFPEQKTEEPQAEATPVPETVTDAELVQQGVCPKCGLVIDPADEWSSCADGECPMGGADA